MLDIQRVTRTYTLTRILLAAVRRASSLPILHRASSALLRPAASPVPATRRSSSSSIDAAKTALMKAALDTVRAEHGSGASAAALDSLRAAANSLSTATFDAQLLHGIDSAIKSSQHHCPTKMEETARWFPFEISEDEWETTTSFFRNITLKRTFEDEVIKVRAYKEERSSSSVTLQVTVSKSNGPTELKFKCDAYPDDIIIRSMSMEHSREVPLTVENHRMSDYNGFNELDENMQKSFHKYLELRGITPTVANSLHEYISGIGPARNTRG